MAYTGFTKEVSSEMFHKGFLGYIHWNDGSYSYFKTRDIAKKELRKDVNRLNSYKEENKMKDKKTVSSIAPMIMVKGVPYYLNLMLYTGGDIETHKKNLKTGKIKFRTVKYKHPKENLTATLFYIDNRALYGEKK